MKCEKVKAWKDVCERITEIEKQILGKLQYRQIYNDTLEIYSYGDKFDVVHFIISKNQDGTYSVIYEVI